MKKSRCSEEQMVAILREAERSSVTEVAKRHKVSEQTIYVWRQRFGKLELADVKHLCQLEAVNAKLKKIVAERGLSKSGAPAGSSKLPALGAALPLGARRARWAGPGCQARRCRPVPPLRLSENSSVPETRESPHEPAPRASPVTLGGAAAASQTTPLTRGDFASEAAAGNGTELRLGLRLRVRRQRQRPADQVPDGDR